METITPKNIISLLEKENRDLQNLYDEYKDMYDKENKRVKELETFIEEIIYQSNRIL